MTGDKVMRRKKSVNNLHQCKTQK